MVSEEAGEEVGGKPYSAEEDIKKNMEKHDTEENAVELLTITQAARYVGLSRTSFYKLIERGDVRPVRLLISDRS